MEDLIYRARSWALRLVADNFAILLCVVVLLWVAVRTYLRPKPRGVVDTVWTYIVGSRRRISEARDARWDRYNSLSIPGQPRRYEKSANFCSPLFNPLRVTWLEPGSLSLR